MLTSRGTEVAFNQFEGGKREKNQNNPRLDAGFPFNYILISMDYTMSEHVQIDLWQSLLTALGSCTIKQITK